MPETKVGPSAEVASRDIPSLDGLRAASVLLVILAHSRWFLPPAFAESRIFDLVIGGGFHGVAVFFVISGYLITTLLLREFDRNGTVSLHRFYFRRTLRIFPPFYVFLAAIALLSMRHIIAVDVHSWLAAATYTWALYPGSWSYYVTHAWSLSIEEIFYLAWPMVFVWGHRRARALHTAIALIVLMPLVRVALYFIAPPLRGHETYMVQGWIDTMMVGCLLAIVQKDARWIAWRRRYLTGWVAAALALIGFLLSPLLQSRLPHTLSGLYYLLASFTVTALCIAGILVYLVDNADSVAGRLMNLRWVRHIGMISYSLYLWQQIFMSHQLRLLPLGYVFALMAAEVSFWCVERPSMQLRSRIETRWKLRPTTP